MNVGRCSEGLLSAALCCCGGTALGATGGDRAVSRSDDLAEIIESLERGRAWTHAFSMQKIFDIECSDGRLPVRTEVPVFRRNGELWEWELKLVPLSPDDQRQPSTAWYVFLSDSFFVDVAMDGDPLIAGLSVFTLDAERWRRLKLNAPTSGAPLLGSVWGPIDIVELLRACPQAAMERINGRIRVRGESPFGAADVELDPASAYQPVRWSLSRDRDDLIGETPVHELGLLSWRAQFETTAFHEIDGFFIPAKLVLTESRTFADGTSRTDTYSYEVAEVDLGPNAVKPESFGLTIPDDTIMPLLDSEGNATGVSYRWQAGRPHKLVPNAAAAFTQSAVTDYRRGGKVVRRTVKTDERAAGPYCGVICLAGLAAWFNQPFDIDSAINPDFLRSASGVSLQQMRAHAANDWGIRGDAVQNLTALDCTFVPAPAILTMRSSPEVAQIDHFVLLIDASPGSSVTIIDSAIGVKKLSVAELDARFGGVALVFASDTQISRFRAWTFVIRVAVGAALLCLVVAIRLSAAQARAIPLYSQVGLLILAASLGVVVSTVLPISLDGGSVRFVKAQHAPSFVKKVAARDLEMMIRDGSALPIDARSAVAFGRVHMPSAIHLPAHGPVHPGSAPLPDPNSPSILVVYCENEGCDYDDVVVRRLAGMGHRRLALLKGGWEAWTMRGTGMDL